MRRFDRPAVRLALAAVTATVCACGGNGSSSPAAPAATPQSIVVQASGTFVTIGQRVQMTATANYSDNSFKDVTALATWQTSNPTVVSLSTTGVATALAAGASLIRATYGGAGGTLQTTILGAFDVFCDPYNTATLTALPTSDYWTLYDGSQYLVSMATQQDADNAVALAQRYTTLCFIGRDNPRANRQAYITEYWQGSTGVATPISPEDCTPYATANLQVVNLGATGWAVTDGNEQLVLLDNQADANGALGVLKQYSSQCFIGRNNLRPNPLSFTIPYYK
jgi:hypothetical protein